MVEARRFELIPDRFEMTREQAIEKWSGEEGIDRVFPKGQGSIGNDVRKLLLLLCHDPVCEIGCGTGRIARLFHKRDYFGVDINPDAIEKAKEGISHKKFKVIKWDDPYPPATTYLFYTVLLHIPDDEIEGVISKTSGRVVVAEPMNRWIREYGLSMNFQRDPGEYRELFERHGMNERSLYHARLPYFPYYIQMVVYA